MSREDKLDILFLGGLYPKEKYDEIFSKSKTGIQNAANQHQWNIVEGLDKNLGYPINLLNVMFIGSYPKKYSDMYINSYKFSHTKGANDYNVGYLNLSFIKQFHIGYSTKKSIKRWASINNLKKKVLIIYSTTAHFLEAAKIVKKVNNDINICLIVPDLPAYVGLHTASFMHNLYKKYHIKTVKNNLRYIDEFVFLTKQMNTYFGMNKPFVVVEGMSSIIDSNYASYENESIINFPDRKIILYSGSLAKKYGVIDLVEAFRRIKRDDIVLVLCGEGDAKEEILKHSMEDERIIYKGLLAHSEVLELQKEAFALVNPRKNNEEYTKYSFPSKTFEYLSTGKPVLCHKLDGIPREYDNHLIYFDDEKIESMTQKILDVCNFGNKVQREISIRNKKFIIEEKNNVHQTKKILDLIKENLK